MSKKLIIVDKMDQKNEAQPLIAKETPPITQSPQKPTLNPLDIKPQIVRAEGIDPPKAYEVWGIPFYSSKVFYEFIIFSLLIIVVPIFMVMRLGPYVQTLEISETRKTVYKAVPAVLFINIVLGVYIYRTIKDPANYQILKNEPIRKRIEINPTKKDQ